MTRCLDCSKDISASKEWQYGQFSVKSYNCSCGKKFREYISNNKVTLVESWKTGWRKSKV